MVENGKIESTMLGIEDHGITSGRELFFVEEVDVD